MTVQKTEIEQARSEMVKTIRSAVRLRHSIAADRELNEVLPQAEKAFNAAVQRGELLDTTEIKALLGDV